MSNRPSSRRQRDNSVAGEDTLDSGIHALHLNEDDPNHHHLYPLSQPASLPPRPQSNNLPPVTVPAQSLQPYRDPSQPPNRPTIIPARPPPPDAPVIQLPSLTPLPSGAQLCPHTLLLPLLTKIESYCLYLLPPETLPEFTRRFQPDRLSSQLQGNGYMIKAVSDFLSMMLRQSCSPKREIDVLNLVIVIREEASLRDFELPSDQSRRHGQAETGGGSGGESSRVRDRDHAALIEGVEWVARLLKQWIVVMEDMLADVKIAQEKIRLAQPVKVNGISGSSSGGSSGGGHMIELDDTHIGSASAATTAGVAGAGGADQRYELLADVHIGSAAAAAGIGTSARRGRTS